MKQVWLCAIETSCGSRMFIREQGLIQLLFYLCGYLFIGTATALIILRQVHLMSVTAQAICFLIVTGGINRYQMDTVCADEYIRT